MPVVVKDDAGRRRYIAFRPPADPPSRHKLNRELGPPAWRLTVYRDDAGILRVPHTDVAEARAALEALGAETITTSGTIKKAKARAGVRDA